MMASKLTLDLHLCIFSIPPEEKEGNTYKEKGISPWIYVCLLTARKLIMKQWAKPEVPTLQKVQNDLQYLFRLEKLEAETHLAQKVKNFIQRWRNYIERTYDPQTINLIVQPFQYTTWYAKADLSNSLGKLKIQKEDT